MKVRALKSNKGIVLVVVVVFILILTILGFSVLSIANSEIVLAQKDINKAKAFYLAEAGLEVFTANLSGGNFASIGDTALGAGSYRVDFYANGSEPCAIATGVVGGAVERIQVKMSFLAPPYECGIYAGGLAGGAWTLIMRGTGSPVPKTGGEYGGKDIINGNIFVDGGVALYQQSSVNPAPLPNTYELEGDVDATGDIFVDVGAGAKVSGDAIEDAEPQDPPDLVGMNYAVNNTHNVGQIFASNPVDYRGRLPVGNPLRNVFAKNPTYDRATECASTVGDDYFFEPSTGFIGGNWKTAPTPLHAGANRIYYIDGNLWVNSKSDTYGFNMDGKATIVVTGDIYICDNLKYANTNSDMLGLVALGKYNSSGQLISGGNVIFGDPVYGTMYTFSGMMFAANNFLYNSKVFGTFPKEPESGFTVNGNISALNKVSIERDWYTRSGSERRPARYDSETSKWYDSGTGVVLTSTQSSTMKHYQMIVDYDDRVRNQSTQPRGLPRGVGLIFGGITNWEELP